MSNSDRSPSPQWTHPVRAFKQQKAIDDFDEFSKDVQDSVRLMLPTSGRRYVKASICAVDFSVSDLPDVVPIRDELLVVLEDTYNWNVEKHTIDCTLSHDRAQFNLNSALSRFITNSASRRDEESSLLCFYFSGHGFRDKGADLSICGSFRGSAPNKPYLRWSKSGHVISQLLPPRDQRLVILDCCAAGLAHLQHSNIEVLAASAWESQAPSSSQANFTKAIIDELKNLRGAAVSTTQLVSRLHSLHSVRRGMSMPVHKRALGDDVAPALIHRIERTSLPSSALQTTAVPNNAARVRITVKVRRCIHLQGFKGSALN